MVTKLLLIYSCDVDDECACSTAAQSEKDAKKSYIPRRLVIGNDEYVVIFPPLIDFSSNGSKWGCAHN